MNFLGRLLQLTVLVGAFYDAVEFIKPGLSTARFLVIDLLLFAVYVAWLFQVISGRARFPSLSQNKSLYLFILVLLVPIGVGLAEDHLLETVLGGARTPYYFVMSLVVMSFAEDEKSLRKLLTAFLFVGIVSAAWGYLVYAFKIPIHTSLGFQMLTTGRAARHFGYHSSHVLLLVCILLLYNYLLVSETKLSTKCSAFICLLLFAAGLCLTLIRGLFIGMVSGFVVSTLIQRGKVKGTVMISTGLLAAVLGLLVLVSSSETIREIKRIPIVERYMSVVDPSVTTAESRESAEGRFKGIGIVEKAIQKSPLLGMGYGEYRKPRSARDVVDPVFTLLVHSAVSWMLYRTGYIGTILLLICLMTFFVRGLKSFKTSAKGSLWKLSYGTACASFMAICAASIGSNMMYGSDRFSPLFAICLGLLLSVGENRKRYFDQIPPRNQTESPRA